jgi:hypothetical protein
MAQLPGTCSAAQDDVDAGQDQVELPRGELPNPLRKRCSIDGRALRGFRLR